MAEQTKIQWTDHTYNPWLGCTKVSPGCANCYAESLMDKRYGKVKWGRGQKRQRTSAANWRLPLKWNNWRECPACGGMAKVSCGEGLYRCAHCAHRPRVFCASLADWLDDEVPTEWLADLLKLIHDTPNLDWLLLTKRLENWVSRLAKVQSTHPCGNWSHKFIDDWLSNQPPKNIWIGTSVENQEMADKRIPELLKIPAKVRFLSVEPMLGRINFSRIGGSQSTTPYALRGNFWDVACENHCSFRGFESDLISDPEQSDEDAESNGTTYVCPKCHCESGLVGRDSEWPGVDWVIFGGESGPGARPCNIEWIRDGVRQCHEAGVAAFVKQVGSRPVCTVVKGQQMPDDFRAFSDPKGGDMSEWPEDLRVREFPGVAR